jgi:hypothetical protein
MLETKSLIQTHGHWVVFISVIAFGASVAFYMLNIDKYSLTFYGDSASHLIGARKIVDWMDPGLSQLGTVWLPLPHLLLLPFSLVDSWFTSGLAGTIVSLPSLAITAALLYKMIRVHIVEGCAYIAIAGALLYASNPNILYVGLTAMTEAPFMLFFVASAYYFQNWRLNSSSFRNLLLCSVFVALATLCRYEGWILAAFLVPFAVVFMAKENADSRRKLCGILLSLVCFSGIVLWLGYNAYRYGDPLEFANASYYSASSQALDRSVRETLFLQPANVISVYGTTAVMMYGPILLAGALTGFLYHRRMADSQTRKVLYIYLSLPPIFTVITLIIGIGEMAYWFNSRFLILLSPLIIMLIAVSLKNLPQRFRKHRPLIGSTVAALFLFQLVTPAFAVITYLDAKGGFFYGVNPYAVRTGEELRSLYDGGGIATMTGSAQEHRIMLTSGISLSEYDELIESSTWKKSFYEPWTYNKWLILSKAPDSDGVSVMKYWGERRPVLDENYRLVYENEYHQILVTR